MTLRNWYTVGSASAGQPCPAEAEPTNIHHHNILPLQALAINSVLLDFTDSEI